MSNNTQPTPNNQDQNQNQDQDPKSELDRQLTNELIEINNLYNSQQFNAALARVEDAQRKFPNNFEIISLKLRILRTTGNEDFALDIAKSLIKEFPNKTFAIGEYILSNAACGHCQESLYTIIKYCENSNAPIPEYIMNVIFESAYYFVLHKSFGTALGLAYCLRPYENFSEQFNAIIVKTCSVNEFPIILRTLNIIDDCPDNFPAKNEFKLAITLLSQLRWNEALNILLAISKNSDNWIYLQKNIAVLQYWMFKYDDACETLKILTSSSQLNAEEAAEAELLRLTINPDLLGELSPLLFIEYKITDVNAALEKLLSSPYAAPIKFDSLTFVKQHKVPPKGIFNILDHPLPPDDVELTGENIPSKLTIAMLFGKETDQDARLEIGEIFRHKQNNLEQILKQILGDLLTTNHAKSKTIAYFTRSLELSPMIYFPLNRELTIKQQKNIYEQYYENIFIPQWLNTKFESLGNKSSLEAVKDPAYKIRVLGLINVVEQLFEKSKITNILRQKLGYQLLDIIQVQGETDEEQLDFINKFPVWRWHNIDVKTLSTNALYEAFATIIIYDEIHGAAVFAQEIINRPIIDANLRYRLLAYNNLIRVKRLNGDFDDALKLIDKAKNEAVLTNTVDAIWYMHEIPIRLQLNQISHLKEAIDHVVNRYRTNEKIMSEFYELLIQLGLITPKEIVDNERIAAQDTPTQKPAEFWTPDNANANNTQQTEQTKSKLWTPD